MSGKTTILRGRGRPRNTQNPATKSQEIGRRYRQNQKDLITRLENENKMLREQLKILLLSQGYVHLQFPFFDVVETLSNKVPATEFSDISIEYSIQDNAFDDNLNHSNYIDPNVVFNHTKP